MNILIKYLKYLAIYTVVFELISLSFYGIFKISNLAFGLNFKSSKSIQQLLPHPIFYSNEANYNFDPNTVVFPPNDRFGNKFTFIKRKKNDSTKYIFMTGGSTLEGDGSNSIEDTIPYILQKIMSTSCNDKFRILNYGVSGFTSKQEFLTISTKIIPFNNVDYIISINGVNDFGGNLGKRNSLSKNIYFKTYDTREIRLYNLINLSTKSKYINFFLNKTFTGNLMFDLITNYIDELYPYKLAGENLKGITNINHYSIKKLSYFTESSFNISKSKNIKYFHFLQPVIFYKNYPTITESNTLRGLKNTYGYAKRPNYMFDNLFWSQFNLFYKESKAELSNKNYSYDISGLFKLSKDKDFVDHLHYTPLANKKIAKKIFQTISKELNCK